MKLLGENYHDLGLEEFLEVTHSMIQKREKWVVRTSSKLKTCSAKDTGKKTKRQAIDREEISVTHVANKTHIQSIRRTLGA